MGFGHGSAWLPESVFGSQGEVDLRGVTPCGL